MIAKDRQSKLQVGHKQAHAKEVTAELFANQRTGEYGHRQRKGIGQSHVTPHCHRSPASRRGRPHRLNSPVERATPVYCPGVSFHAYRWSQRKSRRAGWPSYQVNQKSVGNSFFYPFVYAIKSNNVILIAVRINHLTFIMIAAPSPGGWGQRSGKMSQAAKAAYQLVNKSWG